MNIITVKKQDDCAVIVIWIVVFTILCSKEQNASWDLWKKTSFLFSWSKKSVSGSQGVICSLINEYVCVPDIGGTYVYQGLGVEWWIDLEVIEQNSIRRWAGWTKRVASFREIKLGGRGSMQWAFLWDHGEESGAQNLLLQTWTSPMKRWHN